MAPRAVKQSPFPPQLEKAVEADCDELYASVGCEVVRFSQARATQQSFGIPDRKVYARRVGLTWWHEVKRPGGKQSKDQRDFQIRAEACGETYVLGGVEAAKAQLLRVNLARMVRGEFTLTPSGRPQISP
jgi:hypothetical protein